MQRAEARKAEANVRRRDTGDPERCGHLALRRLKTCGHVKAPQVKDLSHFRAPQVKTCGHVMSPSRTRGGIRNAAGGWPKSVDFAAAPTPQPLADAVSGGRANSLDNDATTVPMQFLARVAQATGDEQYRRSFVRGLDYLMEAQYPNGGWPQFFALREGYYSRITFNDGAMIHALTLLRDVAAGEPPYDFADADRRATAAAAVAKGVDCILRTQIKQDGKLTAWCAQHDEITLAPTSARRYEVPSLSGAESVGIVRFLMAIDRPTPDVIAAVEGAVAWLRAVTVTGLRYERGVQADGKKDGHVARDPTAGPLWARFYELASNRPIFVGWPALEILIQSI